jgi:hemolysin III
MEDHSISALALSYHDLPLEQRLAHVKQLSSDEEWIQGLLLGDEWANCLTHAVGLILSLIGLVLLIEAPFQEQDHWRMMSFAVFGGSLILLYAASTFYHAVKHPKLKKLFRTLDHCAIYLLIAGSYTPFTMLLLGGVWGWVLFGSVWSLAVLGIFFKIFFKHRFKILSTSLYLFMGWLVIIAIEPLLERFHSAGLCWLLAGGLSYTGGVIFYVLDKRRFFHAIWHLFVLVGSVCHYLAVFLYI